MGVVGLGVTVILSLEHRTTGLKVENGKQGREKTFKSLRKDSGHVLKVKSSII